MTDERKMTKSYYVVNYNPPSQPEYAKYLKPCNELLNKYISEGKAKLLIAQQQMSNYKLEGTPKGTLFIVEFDNEIMDEFSQSKEFQDLTNFRKSLIDGWAAIVPQFSIPQETKVEINKN